MLLLIAKPTSIKYAGWSETKQISAFSTLGNKIPHWGTVFSRLSQIPTLRAATISSHAKEDPQVPSLRTTIVSVILTIQFHMYASCAS